MLFGDFSIADAFFAPVAHAHASTFALPVPAAITAYVERVQPFPASRHGSTMPWPRKTSCRSTSPTASAR
jgi:glutathione S-transferase